MATDLTCLQAAAARQAPPGAHPLAGLKAHFITFGCQMNKYDSAMAAGLLQESHVRFTDAEEDAELLVINTCSVRAHAEQRVYSLLGALERRKRRRPDLLIAVVGCMAQKESSRIAQRFPHVDLIVGTRALDELPRLVERLRDGADRPLIAVEEKAGLSFGRVVPRRELRAQAYLAVSRGCDKRCTFCVVPYTRGPEASRPVAELADEARRLVDDGAREITLVAQTIDTYGRDIGTDLCALLRALHPLAGLDRLRFITSHPAECDEDLWRTMAELGDKVMPFVHLPAQSGSDRVLRRMGRGYTRARYLEVVGAARRLCPQIEIATDFIVGFSGETDADFAQTLALAEEIRFQSAYIFKYSAREGTPANKLPDDVPEEIKRRRHGALSELQARISLQKNRERIGKLEEVLAEGPSKTDPARLTGRSRSFRLAHFAGPPTWAGRLANVRITGASALSLTGEFIGFAD